ncbi:MAG: hypothetical protein LBH70_02200 [Spirochaetaceae bacterium]|jgi:hypothetical protein|nr:hypothetical protein [Spirochaetaceae bacterium]
MNQRIKQVLEGKGGNYIFPFFWQHGEDEATLRKYMRVIQEAGIGAVCVESRPHPDFCGPQWWHDMDIILDEARRRNMKVWILDDSHFPTGFANGALAKQPDSLRRRSICATVIACSGKEHITLDREALAHPKPPEKTQIEIAVEQMHKVSRRMFDDDRRLGVIALRTDGPEHTVNLSGKIRDGVLEWDAPEGTWKIYVLHISANGGYHPEYINMMDEASCRVLIDAVYEPHYARYKDDFGKTIAGFFSDEPEFGNGHLYAQDNTLGTDQDLPWSAELEDRFRRKWGENYAARLPLLWENGADPDLTARVRYGYMDTITRLVEKDFSLQTGTWCRAHGVEYIGHIIEDNNQHARTGSSLGHFFRSMSGQDMAGIDDIGGQVFPQGEDVNITGQIFGNRDGEFYHYALGKLASSCAAIDPLKQGRAMCEIFGNYGWKEGVQLEKYLIDHFLVRGVNNFVPHAFSPKAYPDSDCPPHFYAHGHNPQYRHFGRLMGYTSRLCHLLNGGAYTAAAALLYHAEAEWTGGEYMLTQKPARRLMDNQIDFDIIPADVFTETERYRTGLENGLQINTRRYRAFIVPMARFIPAAVAEAAAELHKGGFPVIFIDRLPYGVCDGGGETLDQLNDCPVVSLEGLVPYLRDIGVHEIDLAPANNRIRCIHYKNNNDMYFFVNEGTEACNGTVCVPSRGNCFAYNAWDNRLEKIKSDSSGDGTSLSIRLEPYHSLMVIFGETEGWPVHDVPCFTGTEIPLPGWKRSLCKSTEYPVFGDPEPVELPDTLAKQTPDFSGFIRYETEFALDGQKTLLLEISNAAEGVEVFVNGESAGIQILPPYRYNLSDFTRQGQNRLAIEVATTLERERMNANVSPFEKMKYGEITSQSGITGSVRLYAN